MGIFGKKKQEPPEPPKTPKRYELLPDEPVDLRTVKNAMREEQHPASEAAPSAATRGKAETLLARGKETPSTGLQASITFKAKSTSPIELPAVRQGQYTIVSVNNSHAVNVFDEAGNPYPHFTDEQASMVVKKDYYEYECDGPAFLRGRYVIFLAKDLKLFVAWNTASDDGVILPPRNWTRYNTYSRTCPQDLHQIANELLEKHGVDSRIHKQVGGKYHVDVIDNAILIKDGVTEVWRDNIPDIGENTCVDPTNPNLLYYCARNKPREMQRLEVSGEPPWHPRPLPFPQPPDAIHNIQMHPTGAFFLCRTTTYSALPTTNASSDLALSEETNSYRILRCDTLEDIPCPEVNAAENVSMGEDGHFYCSKGKKIIRVETNLGDLARSFVAEQRAKMLVGISAKDMIQEVVMPFAAQKPVEPTQDLKVFEGQRKQFRGEFAELIKQARDSAGLQPLGDALEALRKKLQGRGLKPAEVAYVTEGIAEAIAKRQQQLADAQVQATLEAVRKELGAGVSSLGVITEVREKLKIDQGLEQVLSPAMASQVADLRAEVGRKADDLFLKQGNQVVAQITGMVEGQRRKLAALEKQSSFDDWRDRELPKQSRWLSELAATCPAQCIDALDRITRARAELRELSQEYERKFRAEKERIRERASQHTEQTVQYLEEQCAGLLERMQSRHFTTRTEAEEFLNDNPARQELEAEIRMLAGRDADASRRLLQTLQVSLANFLFDIERNAGLQEGADGRTMVPFGSSLFPRFEGHVKKQGKRKTELAFAVEERSKGAGVAADDLMGDVAMRIETADGHKLAMRLWENKPPAFERATEGEDDYRYGSHAYRGQDIAPSYRSQGEFRELRKLYGQWRNNGPLRREHDRMRETVHKHYQERELGEGEDGRLHRTAIDEQWKEEHRTLLQEYGAFCSKNQVPLLRRIESIERAPDPEFENGRGLVPEWQNHWVVAPEDEKVLEQMAKHFKMQLDNQESSLNLKGHAGTGKDVLLKMFAHRTNRPFFAFDCSKWTTEFELSQDISLSDRGGATVTIKEDSVVLQAIQTPGAIMYFNEFNAMPEQAQMFLHALFDEKRSITLKTSSGRTVRADPSALFACSMNPKYPGTFDPQAATRSRMVELTVPYPPLYSEYDEDGKPEPGSPYSASEALKIARSVESLRESTLDPDMSRNAFVQMWDGHVNHSGQSPTLTEEQRFDLDVVLALVQFGNKLRENFIKRFEKSRDANKALPISQPVTLREMRRCAYVLGQMSREEKGKSNPERVAKILLEQFLLSHIDEANDRAQIKKAMDQWTSEKRAA